MATDTPRRRASFAGLTLPLHLARPMVDAAAADFPAPIIRPLLDRFGFDGLTYLVGRNHDRGTAGRIVWSTHPPEWAALYCRANYSAIDPRLTNTRSRFTPYLWDASGLPDDPRTREFVGNAARYRTCSGVAIAVHDSSAGHVVLAFDSRLSPVPVVRRECIAEILGDLMLVTVALHEGALSWRIADGARGNGIASTLTNRERECLRLAARGLTSADIGNKLSVSERTINFHFGNLRRKLGALNRPEAIAKGAALGLMNPD